MIDREIISVLKKKQDYVSGDQLSSRLGISRQALWKHIQELKNTGYDIAAVPHLGYRLERCPDKLLPFEISEGLQSSVIGRKIYYYDSIPSTMDVAMELGLKGAPDGTLVVSELQTKGRGRLGRGWFSPKYKGLYFSLILRPAITPSQAPLLALLAAVSIAKASKTVAGAELQIKWPNDLLAGTKKVGGILTEMAASTDAVNFVIIGVGVNVNNEKKSLIAGASSLKEHTGQPVARLPLLQGILRCIEEDYRTFNKKGPRHIIEEWLGFATTIGRRVKVYCHSQHVEGEAVGIDTDGGLLVRTDAGTITKVMAGDVVHCR